MNYKDSDGMKVMNMMKMIYYGNIFDKKILFFSLTGGNGFSDFRDEHFGDGK